MSSGDDSAVDGVVQFLFQTVVDGFEYDGRGRSSHDFHGLAHRRPGWRIDGRRRNVVKAHDRPLVRDANAGFAESAGAPNAVMSSKAISGAKGRRRCSNSSVNLYPLFKT